MTLNHEGNEIRSMAFIHIYIKTHVAIFYIRNLFIFYEQSIDLQAFVKRRIHRNSLLPIKEPIILILFMPVNHKKKWERRREVFFWQQKLNLKLSPLTLLNSGVPGTRICYYCVQKKDRSQYNVGKCGGINAKQCARNQTRSIFI